MNATRCAVGVALLFASQALADVSAPSASPNSANGIILTEKDASRCMGAREKFNTPAASDVRRLEQTLAKALTDIAAKDPRAKEVSARIGKDIRFYVGTEDGFIQVLGFCAGIVERGGRTCPPSVKDGGSCIWRIRFDVKRGTFDRFDTNGEA
jgi:hypothetical protein